MSTEFFVPRTCTEIAKREGGEAISRPLHGFHECPAYVLLGEPGAGKSKAFEVEKEACGDLGVLVSARDFVTFSREAWRGKTLFIDGLDEMRAGSSQGGAALDAIRKRLDELGQPKFRLSCRAADWYGATDQQGLKQVAPNGEVAVLQLDPLTHSDMQAILDNQLGSEEASAFMTKAEARGLQDWLTNPQTLNMLVEAVTEQEQWPDSRQKTYELACKKMVREQSKAHRDATRTAQPYSDESLLEAAGWLCAVLLLADQTGYALDDDASGDGFVTLSQLTLSDHGLPLATVLKSRLFKPSGVERCVPVHRSVAEYLGAHWLASRINQHLLPLGRVLALITGVDGGVVTGLRGLYAWLSVFCVTLRNQLIERDPLGLVLYGDVKAFSKDDKRLLLQALHRDAEANLWLNYHSSDAPRFGGFATADMADAFREILSRPKPDRSWQVVMDCMMDALQHGEKLHGLEDELLRIVRDDFYLPPLRVSALYVFLRDDKSDKTALLLQLLEEIQQGSVADSDDELMGILLGYLYPAHIPTARILDYLHPPKQQSLGGTYHWFWEREIHQKTIDADVPELLDQFVARSISSKDWRYRHTIDEIKGKLLVRGLQLVGKVIGVERLFNWLGVGLDGHGHSIHLSHGYKEAIATWLSDCPEYYKAILQYGAMQCIGSENARYCLHKVNSRLYGAKPPADIADWYLQQADAASQDDMARAFFNHAISTFCSFHEASLLDLKTLELLEDWVATRPRFQPWLKEYLVCSTEGEQYEHAQWKREHDTHEANERNAWMQYFRGQQDAIRDGTAHPKVLSDLASAYFGQIYLAHGDTPQERLDNFLDHDFELVEDALSGFRKALLRADLPSVSEIVASNLKGSMFYLCWPCQIGMELSTPEEIAVLADDRLASIVAFQYLYPINKEPSWEATLRQTRPDLMARVMIETALPFLRAGKEHIHGLYGLAYSAENAVLAQLSTLPLLQGFPVRAKKALLLNLRYLLVAGLRYMEKSAFLALLETKLGFKLDDPQRVYWLAAGMVAAPETYTLPLIQFVGKSQKKAEYAAGFFSERHDQYSLTTQLPTSSVAWLIEKLGPPYRPYDRFKSGVSTVTHAMHMSDLVQSWIRHLGSISSLEAGNALTYLIAQPSLAAWHDELRITLRNQRVIQRDYMFQHPPLERVCRTLNNLQPANPADLAALTLDHLRDLREKIRHAPTNDYRQYWSFDSSNKKLALAKPENECRDALLSDLQERFARLGIDAIKEGYYAEDKRADIRVSFGGASGFNIPIEIKKDSHRDLWTAIQKQLIDQYTQDPATGGFGIYLVFWFGGDGMPLHVGKKPLNSSELEIRLSEILTEEQRKKISVIVLDCSLP